MKQVQLPSMKQMRLSVKLADEDIVKPLISILKDQNVYYKFGPFKIFKIYNYDGLEHKIRSLYGDKVFLEQCDDEYDNERDILKTPH